MAGHPVASLAAAVTAARTSLAADGQCPRGKAQALFHGLGAVATIPEAFRDPSVTRDAFRCIALALSAVRGNDTEFTPMANALFATLTDRHHSCLWHPPEPLESPLNDVLRCLFGPYVEAFFSQQASTAAATAGSRPGAMLEALVGPLPPVNAAIYTENMLAAIDGHIANGAIEFSSVVQRLVDALLVVRAHPEVAPQRPSVPPQGSASLLRLLTTRLGVLLDGLTPSGLSSAPDIVSRILPVISDLVQRGFAPTAGVGIAASDVAAMKLGVVLQGLGHLTVPLRLFVRRIATAASLDASIDASAAGLTTACFHVLTCLLVAIVPVQPTASRWANVKPAQLFDPSVATPQNTEDLMAALQLATLLTAATPTAIGPTAAAVGMLAPSPSSAVDAVLDFFVLGRDHTVARQPVGRKYTMPRRVPGGLRQLIAAKELDKAPALYCAVVLGSGLVAVACTGVLCLPSKKGREDGAVGGSNVIPSIANVAACALTLVLRQMSSAGAAGIVSQLIRAVWVEGLAGALLCWSECQAPGATDTLLSNTVAACLRNVLPGTASAVVWALVSAASRNLSKGGAADVARVAAHVELLPRVCAWSLWSLTSASDDGPAGRRPALDPQGAGAVAQALAVGAASWTIAQLESDNVAHAAAVLNTSPQEVVHALQTDGLVPSSKAFATVKAVFYLAAIDVAASVGTTELEAVDVTVRLVRDLEDRLDPKSVLSDAPPAFLVSLFAEQRLRIASLSFTAAVLRAALLSKAQATLSPHLSAVFDCLTRGNAAVSANLFAATVLPPTPEGGSDVAGPVLTDLLKRLKKDDLKRASSALLLSLLQDSSVGLPRSVLCHAVGALLLPSKDPQPFAQLSEWSTVCAWLCAVPSSNDAISVALVKTCLDLAARHAASTPALAACAPLWALLHRSVNVEATAASARKAVVRLEAVLPVGVTVLQALTGPTSDLPEETVAWLRERDNAAVDAAAQAEAETRAAEAEAAAARAAAEEVERLKREQQRAAAEEARRHRAAEEAAEKAERERRNREAADQAKAARAAKEAEAAAARAAEKEQQATVARRREEQLRAQRTVGEWKAALHRLGMSNTAVTSTFAELLRAYPQCASEWSFENVLEFAVAGAPTLPWTRSDVERRIKEVSAVGFRDELRPNNAEAEDEGNFWASLQRDEERKGTEEDETSARRNATERVESEAAARCFHARVAFIMDAFAYIAASTSVAATSLHYAAHPALDATAFQHTGGEGGHVWFQKTVESVDEYARRGGQTASSTVLATVGLPVERHVQDDADEAEAAAGPWYADWPHSDLVGQLLATCTVPIGYVRRCATAKALLLCPEARGQLLVLLDVLQTRGVIYYARNAGVITVTPLGARWHAAHANADCSFALQRNAALVAWEAKMALQRKLAEEARERRRLARAQAKAARKEEAEAARRRAAEEEATRLHSAAPSAAADDEENAFEPIVEDDDDGDASSEGSTDEAAEGERGDDASPGMDQATSAEDTQEHAAVEDLWETMGIDAVIAEMERRREAERREARRRQAKAITTTKPPRKKRPASQVAPEAPTDDVASTSHAKQRRPAAGPAQAPASVPATTPLSEEALKERKAKALRQRAGAQSGLIKALRKWAPRVVGLLLLMGVLWLLITEVLEGGARPPRRFY